MTHDNATIRMLSELLSCHDVTIRPVGHRDARGECHTERFRLEATGTGRFNHSHTSVYTGTLDAVIARAWAGQPDTDDEHRRAARAEEDCF